MQTETQTDARTDRRARTSWGAWGAHDVDTEHPPRPSPWTNQGKASNFCRSDSTTVFARNPPARRRGSLHVNFRVILLSYRRLITRRLGNLVTLPCYCLLVITATPLRRLRYAVTRAPLSRSLRDGSGRLGTGPGRTRQSKPLYIHARTNWLVRQWALLHGPARAGPRWVSGGQELDRGKAIAHRSVLKRRLR